MGYWKKLVDAEDNHEKQIKALKHEIVRLQNEMTECKKKIEWLTTSKYNLIVECDKQMNELRNAVTVYAKKKTSWFCVCFFVLFNSLFFDVSLSVIYIYVFREI